MNSIVIIGKGVCGTATASIFNNQVDFHDPEKGEVVDDFSQYCYAVICVPTPSLAGGRFNYSDLEDVYVTLFKQGFQGIAVIRSTCDPEFLTRISEVYEKTVYWPEFLRENSAEQDAKNPHSVIVGGEKQYTTPLVNTLKSVGHTRLAFWKETDLLSASIIKLGLNSALAAKISMFNSIYKICEKVGADWETVNTVIGNDPRIGGEFTDVPGHDGKLGFGGKCLPKDLRTFQKLDEENVYLDAIRVYNKNIRK